VRWHKDFELFPSPPDYRFIAGEFYYHFRGGHSPACPARIVSIVTSVPFLLCPEILSRQHLAAILTYAFWVEDDAPTVTTLCRIRQKLRLCHAFRKNSAFFFFPSLLIAAFRFPVEVLPSNDTVGFLF